MPQESRPVSRDHYSYRHYADANVAAGFDALRFSGPIGGYLLESQAQLLADVLGPLPGRRIADVGAGTGRAAIGLASGGASVISLDASVEMLRVARTRAASASAAVGLSVADAHALPLCDRSVDAALSLRVLMHAIDWRRCVTELCRVARWRVVVDFPALGSFAAIESGARRLAGVAGRSVEAYRVISERDVRTAFERHGFRIVRVHREFVLPIAFHKAVGRLAFTTGVERALARAGLLRLLGSPVTVVAER